MRTENPRNHVCTLSREARQTIRDHCRAGAENEWAGLLVAEPASEDPLRVVRQVVWLPAETSRVHATVDPVATSVAIQDILRRGQVPVGYVHGHGEMPVFHSGTDRRTEETLMTAFAPYNWERFPQSEPSPTIGGPDFASVSTPLGTTICCRLIGRRSGASAAPSTVEWTDVRVQFDGTKLGASATFVGGHLVLSGNATSIRLGIPAGATVELAEEDRSAVKIARLFSVVSNRRDQLCGSLITVREVLGVRAFELANCEVTSAP